MMVLGFAGAGLLVIAFPQIRPDAPLSRFFEWGMAWGGEYFGMGFATACFLYFSWGFSFLLKRAHKRKPPQDPGEP